MWFFAFLSLLTLSGVRGQTGTQPSSVTITGITVNQTSLCAGSSLTGSFTVASGTRIDNLGFTLRYKREDGTCTIAAGAGSPQTTTSPASVSLNPGTSPTASATVSFTYAFPTVDQGGWHQLQVSAQGTQGTETIAASQCSSSFLVFTRPSISLPATVALNCTNQTITVNTTTPAVRYLWSTGATTQTLPLSSTTTSGTYSVTATSSEGGCTATASTSVITDFTAPQNLSLTVNSPLNCTATTVTLTAASSTTGVTYTFSGPGVVSQSGNTATVNQAGTYTVTARGANGCQSTATVTVQRALSLTASNALNCRSQTAILTATSSTSGTTYSFSGPGIATQGGNIATVNQPGIYNVIVTEPGGCTAVLSINVERDTLAPQNLNLQVNNPITCTTPTAIITASSSATGVTYAFSGSGITGQTGPTATVNQGGTYTVTATGLNGCATTRTISVQQNNTAPQNVSLLSANILTCANPTSTLTATSTTEGLTYSFRSPASTTATVGGPNTAVANAPGAYTVVATAPNGCTAIASVNVQQNIAAPAALSLTASGPLNCTALTVNLTASSTTTGVSYAFGGTGITGQNNNVATVNASGSFSVVATAPNGCTATATTNVQQNTTAPAALSVNVSNQLTCTNQTATITAASSTTGLNYGFNGPGITGQNQGVITVNQAGNYVIVATAPNGCTTTATATIVQNTTTPEAVQLTTSNVLSCTAPVAILTATSSTTGVSYRFSGPGITGQSSTTATVNQPGTYTVTTTSPNGCVATATVTVAQDIAAPADLAVTAGNPITCNNRITTLTATSSTPNVLYAFRGPDTTRSTGPNTVQVSSGGLYTVTATAPNGCRSTATVNVQQNTTAPQGLNMVVGSVLTCSAQTATLTASSTTAGLTYAFGGPGVTAQGSVTATVNQPGTYTVTATAPSGCTATTTAVVQQNTTIPQSLSLTASNVLTCSATTATLTGSSSTPGVTYAFSGGSITGQGSTTATVNQPGLYTVAATAPNGCVTTATVTVLQDITTPAALSIAVSNPLNCTTLVSTLRAGSTTPGVSYVFSGTGITGQGSGIATVNAGGSYTVVATGQNGCTSTTSVSVPQDTQVPQSLSLTTSNPITCNTPMATLTASSSTPNVTYAISGTGISGRTATTANINAGGSYTVVATGQNGCTATSSVTVAQNTTAPAALSLTAGNVLTCSATTATLRAGSTTPGVRYVFSGPGITGQDTTAATVNQPGLYRVTATGPNGCTATTTVTVQQNLTVPQALSVTISNPLTCSVTTATLTAASSTSGVTYAFSGPGITGQGSTTAVVNQPGTYTIIATAPTGCTTTTTASVIQNITTPQNLSLTASNLITCNTPTVTLTAGSSTPGVTYAFSVTGVSGPGATTATVSQAGTYTLTATAPNGCTATTTATVLQNTATPDTLRLTAGNALNCTLPTTTLTATSPTPGLSYVFSGTGITGRSGNTATVNAGGSYTVVATGQNGCTASASVTVSQDIATPQALSLTAGSPLSCTAPTATLTAASSTTGVTYAFTGPGVISQTGATATVNAGGSYTVVATGQNGCTATTSTTVNANQSLTAPQALSLTASGPLTCSATTVTLTGASSTSGVSYAFSGPGITGQGSTTATVNRPGTYIVTATAPNGCQAVAFVNVQQNLTVPQALSIAVSNPLTCSATTAQLTPGSSTTGVSYVFSGPGISGPGSATASINQPGTYTLTATGTNGCVATTTVTVPQNTAAPQGVQVVASNPINCTDRSATLTASSITPNVTYAFSGTGVSSPNAGTATVSAGGTYTVVATAPNGCTTATTVTVQQNTTVPQALSLTVSNPLTCNAPTANLVAGSSTPDVTYAFSGTGITGRTASVATINAGGSYTVIATAPNTCTAAATITVQQNTAAPQALSLTVSGPLTCTGLTATLTAGSSTTGLTYAFSGPGINSQTGATATVNAPGTYTVVARDANGCTATATATVQQNLASPQALSLTVSNILGCAAQTATLTATSSTTGVTYAFGGPGITAPGSNTATVNAAGTYTVTATGLNGCVATTTATVTQDRSAPANVVFTNNGPVTCSQPTVVLTAGSTTPNVTYSFAGPAGPLSGTANTANITAAGTYTVTVTGANGCTATATTTVTQASVGGATVQNSVTCIPTTQTVTGGTYTLTSTVTSPVAATTTYSFRTSATSSLTAITTNTVIRQGANAGETITASASGNSLTLTIGNQTSFSALAGYQFVTTVTTACGTSTAVTTVGNCTGGREATASRISAEPAVHLDVQAYPNPTSDVLTVTISGAGEQKAMMLRLYDLTQRQSGEWPVSISDGKGQITIDIREKTDGVYILSAEGRDGRATRKIVKQN
ncbi:hypothetical protein GCM10023187_20220 [Nibrella viscosa]|uniref:PKD/Chitinase domain-containing protein n=1 Tax=Nibrella viscosa TaxID=1084524 RepID=A0ABP8KBN0_9BACT